MSNEAKSLIEQARALSPEDRIELVEDVLDSLDRRYRWSLLERRAESAQRAWLDVRPTNELLDATPTMTKRVTNNGSEPNHTPLSFPDAVARAFAFLANFGLVRTETLPTIVRYRKGDVEADVYHGPQSYEFGFEIGRGDVKYSMSELIRKDDPDTAKQYRNFVATTPSALIEGLTRLAELVKRYGQR